MNEGLDDATVAETGRPLCYWATVNEPETITAAKPVDRVWRSAAMRPAPPLERS